MAQAGIHICLISTPLIDHCDRPRQAIQQHHLAVVEELGGPGDASHGRQAILPGHHHAVGQLPPALHDQPPQQAKDGCPAWIGASDHHMGKALTVF